MSLANGPIFSVFSLLTLLSAAVVAVLAVRVFYNVYFHPLSQFPGPGYAAATSLTSAIISLRKKEPEWLLGLTKKYGSM